MELTTDPFERRRRQNLLRQRAWRQRKYSAQCSRVNLIPDSSWRGYGMLFVADQGGYLSSAAACPSIGPLMTPPMQRPRVSKHGLTSMDRYLKLIPPLLLYAHEYGAAGRLIPEIVFPLSADHRLITLVQYNVLRALLFNMSILSVLDTLPTGCGQSLHIPSFGNVSPEKIPPDLQPTPVQKSSCHSSLIDALPFPQMRDNIIMLSGKFDFNDLLYDLGQGLYEGHDDAERRGLIVWRDSWSADGWEVSEGFLQKWGFLLEGCSALLDTTNRWRERRGENALVVHTWWILA